MKHPFLENHYLWGQCLSFHRNNSLSAFSLLDRSLAHYKLLCMLAYPSARLYLQIQLACILCAITLALEFTRDEAFKK